MYKRGGVWWASIRHEGKKIQRSLETSDKKLAQAIEAKIRTELVEGKYFDKPIGETKTFRDMMARFMKEHAQKVSLNTQKSYSSSLKHLLKFFGNMALSEITVKKINEYKQARKASGGGAPCINRSLAMLSKAFNLAFKEWEWIKENPVLKVSRDKENSGRDRWLMGDEENGLLENSPQWLRDIIIFALHTGLRQNELLSLTWDRVDLFRKTIIIQETKNGKPRTIPLDQIALDVLIEKSKVRNLKSGLIFLSNVMTKINCQNLIRAFYAALEKTGIQDFHFHDLRHTFATRLAQRGYDLYKLSKLLGHYDISMTQRYAHHCLGSLRDGMQVLEKSDYNLATVGGNGNVSTA